MKTLSLVLAATLALASGATLAKTAKPMKAPMHCMMADGTMDMKMSKKSCMAAKGTWTKASDTMPMEGKGAMPMPAGDSMSSMAPMAPK